MLAGTEECGMKRWWQTMAVLAAVNLAGGAGATDFDSSSTAGLTSNYLFRGQSIAPFGFMRHGSTWLKLTDGLRLDVRDFSYWRMTNDIRDGETDWDFGLRWQPTKTAAAVRVGWITYNRLRWLGGGSRDEVTASYEAASRGRPFLRLFYGYDHKPGFYGECGGGQQWHFGRRQTADLTATLGASDGRGGSGAFRFVSLKSLYTWDISPQFRLQPSLELVVPGRDVASYGARLVPSLNLQYRLF
jgi:hypothetical protein